MSLRSNTSREVLDPDDVTVSLDSQDRDVLPLQGTLEIIRRLAGYTVETGTSFVCEIGRSKSDVHLPRQLPGGRSVAKVDAALPVGSRLRPSGSRRH